MAELLLLEAPKPRKLIGGVIVPPEEQIYQCVGNIGTKLEDDQTGEVKSYSRIAKPRFGTITYQHIVVLTGQKC